MSKPAIRAVLEKWLPGYDGVRNRLGSGLETTNSDTGFDFSHENVGERENQPEGIHDSSGVYHTELSRYAVDDSNSWIEDLFDQDEDAEEPVEEDFYRSPSPEGNGDKGDSGKVSETSTRASVSFESKSLDPDTVSESDLDVSVTVDSRHSTPEPTDIEELGNAIEASRNRADGISERINEALSTSTAEVAEARISSSSDSSTTPLAELDSHALEARIELGSSIEAIQDAERRLEEGFRRTTATRGSRTVPESTS